MLPIELPFGFDAFFQIPKNLPPVQSVQLPFHVADSLTLAMRVRQAAQRGVLDLGTGSGLPSVLIACVNPELPVYAVESKSRKTRFLERAAAVLELPLFVPLTSDVNELSRRSYFDVDHVTAKAFKPLPEVGPIGERCILHDARLLVPISEAQVGEFALGEEKLERRGDGFIYYSDTSLSSTNCKRSWGNSECEAGPPIGHNVVRAEPHRESSK